MFLDHPTITATNSPTEPDRIERLDRVYGYAMALADADGDSAFVDKLTQVHDHKGTLIVFWQDAPSEAQMAYWTRAWASKVGDGTATVVHEY
jgi:hypothetical protein